MGGSCSSSDLSVFASEGSGLGGVEASREGAELLLGVLRFGILRCGSSSLGSGGSLLGSLGFVEVKACSSTEVDTRHPSARTEESFLMIASKSLEGCKKVKLILKRSNPVRT